VDGEPVLAGLAAAAVEGRVALGPRAGAAIRRCGTLPDEAPLPTVRGPCHAALGGFDLDATVSVPAGARDHLERVCRYALRPPIAQDRIGLTREGDVLLELRHRWSDGTTHLRFHPLELLERLASVTPRPRINLVLYYGVLAAHGAWRARLPRPGDAVAMAAERRGATPVERSARAVSSEGAGSAPMSGSARPVKESNWLWARLMQRTFGFDVLACPRCGGRFRLVALIEHAGTVRRIFRHLGLPAEVPPPRLARAPPSRREARIAESGFDTP
jgi:hypothetical protein